MRTAKTRRLRRGLGALAAMGLVAAMWPAVARAAEPDGAAEPKLPNVLGFKLAPGGRYDDVRMCVASPAGVRGGPAMDIALHGDFGLGPRLSAGFDLPIFRPIMFAAAFDMLQFEPGVFVAWRPVMREKFHFVAGPTLGVVLHYGPDYESAASGAGRTDSFFAVGPKFGGWFALDFVRPQKAFNFELGLSPYVAPLWGVNDPQKHAGVVAGGSLDFVFRFRLPDRR